MTDDSIAFRVLNEIGIIEQLGRSAFERVLPHDLTLPQFIVLNHFVRLGGERNPAELARIFQVTKGTMTSTLQRLETKGFIVLRPDPNDGRGKRVSITAAGRRARAQSVEAIAPLTRRMEESLGAEAFASALAPLSAIRGYLDRARDEGGGA